MTTVRNRVFHRVIIAGLVFEGSISADGPYVSCRTGGGVALGVSGLRQFKPDAVQARHALPFGWYVVKYHDEARIKLPGFDQAAVRRLSDEFGLVVLTDRHPDFADRTRHTYFFTSPAWDALRQWVAQHPRIAKAQADCDAYLPRWYERAVNEAKALQA